MKVEVSKLRTAIGKLLEHLEETGHGVVEIPVDFYWSIPAEKIYDAYEKPTELTIGQLSDDWAEIEKIADGRSEPVNYALVWTAALLRRLGEQSKG
ncbi:hypothetical protein LZC95_45050 [Pendulispora brunnea]|uniref:Uncharacterized protein n=1 Tax=Pendulispora brunnea TaxID=2905690 RepID=A0ABZ2K7R4_9BACT